MKITAVETYWTRIPFDMGGKAAVMSGINAQGMNTVWLRVITDQGVEGWGEAAPTRFYGETADSVLAALKVYGGVLPDNPFDMEAAELAWLRALGGNPAARAALSSALHDLAGKRLEYPRLERKID